MNNDIVSVVVLNSEYGHNRVII